MSKTITKKICEVCNKPIDKYPKKLTFLSICEKCLRAQIRYNIFYRDCKKDSVGKYCLDCPSEIYNNCKLIKTSFLPEHKKKKKEELKKRNFILRV